MLLLLLLTAAAAAAEQLSGPSVKLLEAGKESYVNVNGGQLIIHYEDSDYLKLTCPTGVGEAALDGTVLARARVSTRVRRVTIERCSPPRRGYAALLKWLHIELSAPGQLVLQLPASGASLDASHLAELPLASLTLRATSRPPPASADLLSWQPALRRLEVRGVPLAPAALHPASLQLSSLTLVGAGALRVPARVLARLETLVVDEDVQVEDAAPALRVLRMSLAPNAVLPPAARLTNLTLSAWSANDRPWAACDALLALKLSNMEISSLPERWLGACGALRSLEVTAAPHLKDLPERLLEGLGALTTLRFHSCGLQDLPKKLFDSVPSLLELELSSCKFLKTLPGGIFTTLYNLNKLILAKNDFDKDVYALLKPLKKLKKLDLSGNRRLGDACSGGRGLRSGASELRELHALAELLLNSTNVTRICSDWRRLRRLQYLGLRRTSIGTLSLADFQYERDRTVESPVLDLQETNVRDIVYQEADVTNMHQPPDATVAVLLSNTLDCDCDMYHAVRAMRLWPRHLRLQAKDKAQPVRCNTPSRPALQDVPLEDLLCETTCGALPTGCKCAAQQHSNDLFYIRLSCEGAGLRHVPAPTRPPKLVNSTARVQWDLRLARNNISALDELPPDVRWLDLRSNRVERASSAAAAALAELEELRLGEHPLLCECSAAPLLRAVAALAPRSAASLRPARCADGRSLLDASAAVDRDCFATDDAWNAPLLWSGGVVVLMLVGAALAAAAMLTRPPQRALLKQALHDWGWLPRDAEPEDGSWLYHAFLSYAHEDEETARLLTERLEARGLRLCLHSRDWAPGEYIEAQIAASVRNSRRTVALVSRHWLASSWVRVELRMALQASMGAPRLVLVLLDQESALRPDRELRRCLATCTYLHIEHELFLDNLMKALLPQGAAPVSP